jgi:hypothetical protein
MKVLGRNFPEKTNRANGSTEHLPVTCKLPAWTISTTRGLIYSCANMHVSHQSTDYLLVLGWHQRGENVIKKRHAILTEEGHFGTQTLSFLICDTQRDTVTHLESLTLLRTKPKPVKETHTRPLPNLRTYNQETSTNPAPQTDKREITEHWRFLSQSWQLCVPNVPYMGRRKIKPCPFATKQHIFFIRYVFKHRIVSANAYAHKTP